MGQGRGAEAQGYRLGARVGAGTAQRRGAWVSIVATMFGSVPVVVQAAAGRDGLCDAKARA